MNMMLNQDFAQDNEAIGLDKTQGTNPQLARLMKAWESKQASKAKKAGAFGMMAVSLAACGGSDDDDAPAPVTPVEPVGETFMLTTDADADADGIQFDAIVGTDFDDIFEAGLTLVNFSGIIGTALVPELQGGDVIDGGEGDDTLNATVNGNFGYISGNAPTITNIEVVNFQVETSPLIPGFGSANVLVDFRNVDGVEQLWLVDSNSNGVTVLGSSSPNLSVVNVQEITTVGVRNVDDSTYTISYDEGVLGEEAEQAVVLIDVTNTNIVFNLDNNEDEDSDAGISTLSITSAGDNEGITFGGSALNTVETINVSGDGGSLDLGSQFGGLVTLAAAGYAGDLTIDLTNSEAIETVTTGAGDDNINLTGVSSIQSVSTGAGDDQVTVNTAIFGNDPADIVTIAMGAGVDTLTLEGDVEDFAAQVDGMGPYITDFTTVAISGVETLELDVNLDFGDFIDVTFDMTGLTGVTTIAHTGDLDLGDVVVVDGPADLTATYEGSADYASLELVGTESFTVVVDADDFDATFVGTENTAPDSGFSSISTLTLTDTADLDDSGDADFDIVLVNMSDLTTINLDGFAEIGSEGDAIDGSNFDIDAIDANFGGTVTINVGDHDTFDYDTAIDNDVREVFSFSSDVIDADIVGFAAVTGTTGDRLDLSAYGINADNADTTIAVEYDGTFSTITSDLFEGEIRIADVDLEGAASATFIA